MWEELSLFISIINIPIILLYSRIRASIPLPPSPPPPPHTQHMFRLDLQYSEKDILKGERLQSYSAYKFEICA